MAVKTLYWKNAVPTGATLHRSLQDGGSAPSTATTTTGWVANQNAIGQSCIQNGGSEIGRTDGQWGTTLQPSAAPSQTIGDCWRSELPFDGTFANANWTFTFGIRSVTAAYAGRLKLAVRVWRSSDPNGSNAVELTGSRQASAATSANLSTSADTTVTITWAPGGTVTLLGQYLFVNVGIEVTAAGTANTQDVDFRVGSAYTIATSDFTPTPTTSEETVRRRAALAAIPILALGAIFAPVNVALLTPADTPFVNATTSAPDASWIRQVGVDGSRGSRAIYDVAAASTDLIRSPLYINKREAPPPLDLRSDSGQRQPITLQVAAQPPPVVNPQLDGPIRYAWQIADTSADTPKTLTADAQAPIGAAQTAPPPERTRPVADTSRGTFTGLFPVVLPPGYAQTFTAPIAWPPQPADTSRGTAKTLVADAQKPVGAAQTHTAPDRVRPITETSRGTPKPAIADAQAPVGAASTFTAPDRLRPVADTSAKTPKPLIPDAQAPVGAATEQIAPDVRRLPTDTTRGTEATRFAVDVLPPGATVWTVTHRVPSIAADTSRGTPKVAIADAQAPVGAAQTATPPDRVRPVTDSSAGTPKTLVDDAQRPVGIAQTLTQPDRLRPVADTSRSTPSAFIPLTLALPPGAQSSIAVFIAWPYQPADTSFGTPKVLFADAQLPIGAAWTFTPPDPTRPVYDTSKPTAPNVLDDPAVVVIPPPEPPGGAQWRPAYEFLRPPRIFVDYAAKASIAPRLTCETWYGRVEYAYACLVPTIASRISVGRITVAEARALPRGAAVMALGRRYESAGRATLRAAGLEARGRAFRGAGELRPHLAAATGRTFASVGRLAVRIATQQRFTDAAKTTAADASDLDLFRLISNLDDEDSNG